ncbi:MAG: hypothetical protein AABP62_11580 [Planctomycetota bacterium]
MKALWNELVENESGVILSAELILIVTIAVLGIVTGLACLQQAIVNELRDVALAFTGLDQSYATPSYRGCWKWGGRTSWSAGSSFIDIYDGCVGGGSTTLGYGAIGQAEVVCGTNEINSGVGCCTTAPPHAASPAVLAPPPMSAPAGIPCDGCQPGSGVVIPTPTPTQIPTPPTPTH